ncbi:MAG: glycosyltransferase family 39 protein [Planctomycetes bacterium]|nr:glycosyltransferase family 39 protein [Planctomycetota bacterium]
MSEHGARGRRAGLALVVLMVVVGALHVTWLRLDHDPPIVDELRELRKLDQALDRIRTAPLAGLAGLAVLGAPHPPGLTITALPVYAATGRDVRWTRAVNVLYLLVAMAGAFWLVRPHAGPTAGWLVAALVGVAPFAFQQTSRLRLEAPLTAMVPLLVGLALASEGFTRRRPAFLLGLVVGWMMLVKWTAVVFWVGPLVLTLVEAWRRWKAARQDRARHGPGGGLLLFALGSCLALPWYVAHAPDVAAFLRFNEALIIPPAWQHLYTRSTFVSYLFYPLALDDLLGLALFMGAGVGFALFVGARAGRRDRLAAHAVAVFVPACALLSLLQLKEVRHLSPAAPALVWLGVGWLFTAVRPGRARTAGVAVVVLLTAATGLLPAFGLVRGRLAIVEIARGVDISAVPPVAPPRREPWPHGRALEAVAADWAARGRAGKASVVALTRSQGADHDTLRFAARGLALGLVFDAMPDHAFPLEGLAGADYIVTTTLPAELDPTPGHRPTVEAARWLVGMDPPGPPPELVEIFAAPLPVGLDLLVFRRERELDRAFLKRLASAIRGGCAWPPDEAILAGAPRRALPAGEIALYRAPRLDRDGGWLEVTPVATEAGVVEVHIHGPAGARFHLAAGTHRILARAPSGWVRIRDPRTLASGTLDAAGRASVRWRPATFTPRRFSTIYLQAVAEGPGVSCLTAWAACVLAGGD